MTETQRHHRLVRSFVRREGRLTAGQQRALERLYPHYGIAADNAPLDLVTAFGREAPVILDVGFGDGDALATLAAHHPERNYLGIEVYRSGVGRLLRQLEQQSLYNVRVIEDDAIAVLRDAVPAASLAGLNLFFPDPWPKKRHHKRRMVQPAWLALVADRLCAGATLHLATDWADYAEHMLAVVQASDAFHNPHAGYAPDPGERPVTKFERRGRTQGHGVWDIIAQRRARD